MKNIEKFSIKILFVISKIGIFHSGHSSIEFITEPVILSIEPKFVVSEFATDVLVTGREFTNNSDFLVGNLSVISSFVSDSSFILLGVNISLPGILYLLMIIENILIFIDSVENLSLHI